MIHVGDILNDRYTIIRPLGSGGFGTVFLATDSRLGGRQVAIKYFITSHMRPEEALVAENMFQSEAQILANLNHPNLTSVLDYIKVTDGWVLIMGYVPGESLAALQRRLNGPFGEDQVIAWAIALCHVLDFLHRQKPPLIFRDLKPSNIMRTPDDRIMLIDFGIARTFKEGQHQDTVQFGTPGYAPPEQYGGQTEPRSDIYSLGATMYVLLTNERITSGLMIPPVREQAAWVSHGLDALITRMTALHVYQRPVSVQAVRLELERLLGSNTQTKNEASPVLAPPSVPAENSVLKQHTPSNRARWGIMACLLLVLGIASAMYGFRESLFGAATSSMLQSSVATQNTEVSATPFVLNSLIVSTRANENSGAYELSEISLDKTWTKAINPGHSDNAIADRRESDGRLVYTHGVEQDGKRVEQIFTSNADGSAEQQLTSGSSVNRSPRWSPDGTQIVFESARDSTANNQRDIYLMDEFGNNVQRLTSQMGWQGGPAWSPDGAKIVFHTNIGGFFGISVLDLTSKIISALVTLPDQDCFYPDWSPDNQTIAFMTGAGNTTAIYTIPASGGMATQLLNLGAGTNRWPRWSPDGRYLAFESERQGLWQVYVFDLHDATEHVISDGTRSERWPMW